MQRTTRATTDTAQPSAQETAAQQIWRLQQQRQDLSIEIERLRAVTRGNHKALNRLAEQNADLLAALDGAVAWADAQDADTPAEWQEWAFDARAAVARARGEA